MMDEDDARPQRMQPRSERADEGQMDACCAAESVNTICEIVKGSPVREQLRCISLQTENAIACSAKAQQVKHECLDTARRHVLDYVHGAVGHMTRHVKRFGAGMLERNRHAV